MQPDCGAFVGVLNAYASVGALEEGRHAHEQIIHMVCGSSVCGEYPGGYVCQMQEHRGGLESV